MMRIQTYVLFIGGKMMGVITILLGIGICGFLVWFFETILKDIWVDEDCESEVVYLHRERRREDSSVCSSSDEVIVTTHSHVA